MTMKTGKHYLGIILALTIALLITSATGDIYFDKVSLLLPFDGTDGATSTTDISNSNHSLVFGGDAKISAGESKYGGTSCYFDGKGDYLTVADSEDWNFGTGDFTIEFWVWRTGLKSSEGLIGAYPTGWQSAAPLVAVHDNKILITEGKYSNRTKADDAPLIVSTWYHIAFSRRSGTMWLFIDGKLVKFGEDDHSYDFNDIKIGNYNVGPNNYYFSGYLDDIRLTKGVARYTSNFTVPSAMKDGTAPAITQLTEPATVAEGESFALTVTAVGSAPMTYQWSKGGVAINGATEATLLLTDTALSIAGDYTVAISNSEGDVVSDAVKLSVVQPVGIVTQPEGGEVTLGDNFTMNVVASGTEPISYKWRHGDELVNGATGSSLSLAKLTAADLGSYYVVVSNAVGEQTSTTVVVSMSPVITQLTGSMVPVFGDTVELSVTAIGTKPISYRWYLGGVLIEGGTGSTLSLANFQVVHAGDYYVVVSNAVGTLKSDTVTLSALPVITQWTGSETVDEGDSITLSVTALGTPPFSYQWSKGGVEITGATDPTLAFTKAAVSDAADYTVAVGNALGQVESGVVTLTVNLAARIVSQPTGGSASLGGSHTFEVVASGNKPINYKWYQGDDLVQGGAQSALHFAELKETDAGDYHVVISNQTGTETSDTATLFVVVPPAITQLTDQVSVVEGDTLKLTVTAVGTEPKYQWYHDKNKDG